MRISEGGENARISFLEQYLLEHCCLLAMSENEITSGNQPPWEFCSFSCSLSTVSIPFTSWSPVLWPFEGRRAYLCEHIIEEWEPSPRSSTDLKRRGCFYCLGSQQMLVRSACVCYQPSIWE